MCACGSGFCVCLHAHWSYYSSRPVSPSLFLQNNGLCKIIPKRHNNTSEPGDCEAIPVPIATVAPSFSYDWKTRETWIYWQMILIAVVVLVMLPASFFSITALGVLYVFPILNAKTYFVTGCQRNRDSRHCICWSLDTLMRFKVRSNEAQSPVFPFRIYLSPWNSVCWPKQKCIWM